MLLLMNRNLREIFVIMEDVLILFHLVLINFFQIFILNCLKHLTMSLHILQLFH